MLSPTYHLRGDYHTRAYEHVKSLPRSRRLRPAGGLPYTLLRNLLRLLALRPVCGAPRFDRNLTATGYLSLSLPIPLRELRLDKSAVLSLPVPHCTSLSLKENDYEQRRSQVRVLPSAPHRYPRLVAGATLHYLWWLTSNFRRSSESVEALLSTRWSARSLFR